MNIRNWLKISCVKLHKSETPKRDAEVLLSFVTGKPRSWLIAFEDTILNSLQLEKLNSLVSRRAHGIPIAYLIGEREFWSLPLTVSPITLIPRPDTEILVEQALVRFPKHSVNILDLGTGTGAIALALASERPDCKVIGIDRISEAVRLAQYNAYKLAINNARFFVSNWFDELSGKYFSMIVSNPPYISTGDFQILKGDVRFEPISALVSQESGLADIRHIIKNAKYHLLPDGWLILEHGHKQTKPVRNLFFSHNYKGITTYQDYSGNDRITLGISQDREYR